jgi:hypothetical protein
MPLRAILLPLAALAAICVIATLLPPRPNPGSMPAVGRLAPPGPEATVAAEPVPPPQVVRTRPGRAFAPMARAVPAQGGMLAAPGAPRPAGPTPRSEAAGG